MKAVLTDERFSRPRLGLRAQARRHPLHRDQGGRRRPPAARATTSASTRASPRSPTALEADPATTLVLDGEIVAFAGGADELRAPAAARRAARPGLPLRLRPAPPGGPRHHRAAAARAQAAAARGGRLPRPAPPRRRTATATARRFYARGLPPGLGGPDRQARRRAVHARPLARLAEVQVLRRAGARDRRLHRAAGSRTDLGALLLGYYDGGRLRYAGKVGTGFTQATLRDLAARLAAAAPRPLALRRRVREPRRDLGRAASSSRRSASASGRATAACATRATSACATTRRRRRSCASADRRSQSERDGLADRGGGSKPGGA